MEQGAAHRAHCGLDGALGSRGLVAAQPLVHARNGWGCQEARKGHQAGRAPLMPWVWGVLAKPRGGVKVGSSDPAPGSAWLLVQLCIPSVCLITSTGGSQQALGVWDDP